LASVGVLLPAETITLAALAEHAQDIFGLFNTKVELSPSPDRSCKLETAAGLDGSTVFVSSWNDSISQVSHPGGSTADLLMCCLGGKLFSILIENPQGRQLSSLEEAFKSLAKGMKTKLFSTRRSKRKSLFWL
jgi:hypothetical protein